MTIYSEKLKDPRWQKKRLKIMNRDKFTCKLCEDVKTTLNVHHKEYIKDNDPWDYPDNLLITLCMDCHYELNDRELKSINFKDISIYKFIGDYRIMLILIPKHFTIKIYENDKLIIAFGMGPNTANGLIKACLKYLENV